MWFEGSHSDVGGGYEEAGLSDSALLWMAAEAQAEGLVFDCDLLRRQLGPGTPVVRHDPSSALYRVVAPRSVSGSCWAGRGASPSRQTSGPLREDSAGVGVASTTVAHYGSPKADYRPANLTQYAEATGDFSDITESTLVNPSEAYESLLDRFVRECAAPGSG